MIEKTKHLIKSVYPRVDRFGFAFLWLLSALFPLFATAQDEGVLADSLRSGNYANYVLGTSPDTDYVDDGSYSGICQWLYVQDGCDYYLPYGFTAQKATWNAGGTGSETTPNGNRVFSTTNVASVYLPFPFTLTSQTVMKGYKLYKKRNHVESDKEDNTFVFIQQDDGALYKANTAYLVQGVSSSASITSSNVIVPPSENGHISGTDDFGGNTYVAITGGRNLSPNVMNTTDNGGGISDPNGNGTLSYAWFFEGTTERINNYTAASWKVYNLSSNKWYKVETGTPSGNISPMRGFLYNLMASAYSKPAFSVILQELDGTTTAINGIDTGNNQPANSVETRIYNIGGQYVGKDLQALPKGLYIVNGKKIMK